MGNACTSAERRQVTPGYWKSVEVFNGARTEGQTALPLSAVAPRLEALMRPIVDAHVHENLVDYEGIRKSDAYAAYRSFVEDELRRCELGAEDIGSETLQRAFWLNLYNMLTIDAICIKGSPDGQVGRLVRWATASYRLGENVFSLNDIENGVLRSNKQSAVPGTKPQFPADDAKLAFILPLDPRLPFALNCGAISCPPVRVYSEAGLDAELDLSSADYLGRYVRVDAQRNVVQLTRLCNWFASDFGEDDASILRRIAGLVDDAKAEFSEAGASMRAALEGAAGSAAIDHFPYSMDPNWTSDAERAAAVEAERLAFAAGQTS